jgi:hypothetical protein
MKAKPKTIKKKSSSKTSALKVKSASARVLAKVVPKNVDSTLLSLPPRLQANVDQVLKSLDMSPFRLQDLQALGYRILKHAGEISEAIKGSTSTCKKVRSKKG